MISVHPIPLEVTFDFRSIVFGWPRETCRKPNDDLDGTFHLGGFVNGELKGVCSFSPVRDDDRPHEKSFTISTLCVLEEARGQGLGEILLLAGEDKARRLGASHLWGNARTQAAEFYQKYGWTTIGEPFPKPDGGMVIKVFKDYAGSDGCRCGGMAK